MGWEGDRLKSGLAGGVHKNLHQRWRELHDK